MAAQSSRDVPRRIDKPVDVSVSEQELNPLHQESCSCAIVKLRDRSHKIRMGFDVDSMVSRATGCGFQIPIISKRYDKTFTVVQGKL